MLEYFLLCIFGACAYYDFIFKRIPDFITASGWAMLLIFGDGFYFAGFSFTILFFINATLALKDKHIFSWGDILLSPLYVTYAFIRVGAGGEFIAALLMPVAVLIVYVILSGKREKIAFAPFLFVSALIVLAV